MRWTGDGMTHTPIFTICPECARAVGVNAFGRVVYHRVRHNRRKPWCPAGGQPYEPGTGEPEPQDRQLDLFAGEAGQ